ncbi:DUF3782 domain-containing protein [Candidatus Methylospira mobilis]|uniref:DUF3782 domain-containing protein n=1 Tax=Candidatus Methylospira mobilis TaxID=1808979 RepID=A0A5Q0BC98_9GAMM|nr:DUF3782 domain-containing protein [Candidatus Methylospira mobilis]QFY41410.1 DUF3782 domain-containing protein [Candidatus Methylospira mobilis]
MSAVADDIWAILRELAQSQKETDRKFQDTDKKFQDTDKKFQDTDRKIKEVTASIGRLGNRLGDFIEDAVRPAAVRLFQKRGIDVHEVHQSVSSQRGNEGIEIDLLVVNNSEIVAIECKSNLSVDDVNEHLVRLAKLKKLLPAYADKQVIGAVASMVIEDNVAQYAYRKGLYVIGQSGDHLEIRNIEPFDATVW